MIDKSKLDISAIFLGFMALVGDCDRTALAFDMTPEDVRALAESEGWADKIKRVSIMSKSEKPGDWERAQNRALNFVQAYQIRQLLNRWTQHLLSIDLEELIEKTCSIDKHGGTHYSARLLTDITTAAEACQRMSYNALGDTVTERTSKAKGPEGDSTPGDMHAAILSMLNDKNQLPATKEVLSIEAKKLVDAVTERSEAEQPKPENGEPNSDRRPDEC